MKRVLLVLTIIFSSLILSGCKNKNNYVLTIECSGDASVKLSRTQYKEDFFRYKKEFIEAKQSDKKLSSMKELKTDFLKYETEKLKKQCLGRDKRLVVSEEEINKELDKFYKIYNSEKNPAHLEERPKLDEKQLRAIMTQKIKQRKSIELADVAKISDKEIEEFYKKHIYKYTTPKKTYINDILIKTNFATIKREIIEDDKQNKMIAAQVDDLARKKQAENEQLITELREKLKQNPKNFPNLAKIYSQDKERAESGGEFILEEVNSKYPREFIETIEKLEVGQVSEPTRSQYGTHFLYKREIAPEKTQPLSEVKEDVKERIYNSKEHIFFKEVLKKQESEFKITYHDKTLHPDYEKNTNFFQKIIDTIFE